MTRARSTRDQGDHAEPGRSTEPGPPNPAGDADQNGDQASPVMARWWWRSGRGWLTCVRSTARRDRSAHPQRCPDLGARPHPRPGLARPGPAGPPHPGGHPSTAPMTLLSFGARCRDSSAIGTLEPVHRPRSRRRLSLYVRAGQTAEAAQSACSVEPRASTSGPVLVPEVPPVARRPTIMAVGREGSLRATGGTSQGADPQASREGRGHDRRTGADRKRRDQLR